MAAGTPLDTRRLLPRLADEWGPVALAVIGAVALALAGWHGKDYAASTYRVDGFGDHGLVLWDTAWYGGNYPLGYSVLFPPLGALLGLALTGVVSAAVCTWCFDHLVRRFWGRRLAGSWLFALTTTLEVGIGQFPYLVGQAFALVAVVAATRRRHRLAVVAGIAAALCSGVAGVFLAVAVVGWAWSAKDRRGPLVALAVIPIVALGVFNVAFPGTGSFPYPVTGLVWVVVTCAAAFAPPLRVAPAVRAAALCYAALALGAFVIASPMGGNANRLAQSVGIPLLACFAFSPAAAAQGARRRPRGWPRGWYAVLAVVVVPLVVWQWAPGENVVLAVSRAGPTTAGFYRPLVAAVAARAAAPVRVEVVPTEQHWESVYVAQHDLVARGWERQLDIGDNPIFYRPGALNAPAYRRWLLTSGVSFVALPDAPLDYAATAEAKLLRSGTVPGLTLVWRSAQWQLWQVDASPGLLSGPGRVTEVGPDAVTVSARGAATLTVRVRWTRYWTVRSGAACIAEAPGGWTTIDARGPGVIRLGTTFDPLGGGGHC